ncbi:hypothetical protein cyc_05474 [Cyclospora cayetanensis]|uniref:Uncharacterized protein n=1 Tax=Cyclospora cayetanensis TaxID=88456 RepID=A0A1D3DB60_9EIME|nr:hypothetical protein cyc_05474 [Cyclospora cayetanensis]
MGCIDALGDELDAVAQGLTSPRTLRLRRRLRDKATGASRGAKEQEAQTSVSPDFARRVSTGDFSSPYGALEDQPELRSHLAVVAASHMQKRAADVVACEQLAARRVPLRSANSYNHYVIARARSRGKARGSWTLDTAEPEAYALQHREWSCRLEDAAAAAPFLTGEWHEKRNLALPKQPQQTLMLQRGLETPGESNQAEGRRQQQGASEQASAKIPISPAATSPTPAAAAAEPTAYPARTSCILPKKDITPPPTRRSATPSGDLREQEGIPQREEQQKDGFRGLVMRVDSPTALTSAYGSASGLARVLREKDSEEQEQQQRGGRLRLNARGQLASGDRGSKLATENLPTAFPGWVCFPPTIAREEDIAAKAGVTTKKEEASLSDFRVSTATDEADSSSSCPYTPNAAQCWEERPGLQQEPPRGLEETLRQQAQGRPLFAKQRQQIQLKPLGRQQPLGTHARAVQYSSPTVLPLSTATVRHLSSEPLRRFTLYTRLRAAPSRSSRATSCCRQVSEACCTLQSEVAKAKKEHLFRVAASRAATAAYTAAGHNLWTVKARDNTYSLRVIPCTKAADAFVVAAPSPAAPRPAQRVRVLNPCLPPNKALSGKPHPYKGGGTPRERGELLSGNKRKNAKAPMLRNAAAAPPLAGRHQKPPSAACCVAAAPAAILSGVPDICATEAVIAACF